MAGTSIRRIGLSLIVLGALLIGGVVGMQVSDHPTVDQNERYVNVSAPATMIAYQALRQPAALNHRRFDISFEPNQQQSAFVKPTVHRRVAAEPEDGERVRREDSFTSYSNGHCTWAVRNTSPLQVNLNRSGPRPAGCSPEREHFALVSSDSFRAFDNISTVQRIRNTSDIVVLRIRLDRSTFGKDRYQPFTKSFYYKYTGFVEADPSQEDTEMQLRIDTENRTLKSLVIRYTEPSPENASRFVWGYQTGARYRDWGQTSIKRPSNAGYSIGEFLADAAT